MGYRVEPCRSDIPGGYYNIIADDVFVIAEASKEHAEMIVRALNRDELFEDMAEYIRWYREDRKCSKQWMQSLMGIEIDPCGECPICRADALLTKIDEMVAE